MRAGEPSRSNPCLANTTRQARNWCWQRRSRLLHPMSQSPTTRARADSAVTGMPTSISPCAAIPRPSPPGAKVIRMACRSVICRQHRRPHWLRPPLESIAPTRSLPAHRQIHRGVRATRMDSRSASFRRQERPHWPSGSSPMQRQPEAAKVTLLRSRARRRR